MKTSKTDGMFRPFKELKVLLEKKSLTLRKSYDDASCNIHSEARENKTGILKPDNTVDDVRTPHAEKDLFLTAMADVEPIDRGDRVERSFSSCTQVVLDDECESETLQQLNNLVKSGRGFVVSDTSEYIEGTGYNIHPGITRRLHRGDFSIQSHIDLHGLGVQDARGIFERFLKDSIITGKRAVLVVHGRGLSSPERPVLKTKVIEWLTRGPFRKWVIAFTSARPCDGGTGATYVLLRHRPMTRRFRKPIHRK